jgi:hypothetical protein
MLFMPIIFFCTVTTAEIPQVCGFKELPAVSSPRYCSQIVEEVKNKLRPNLENFEVIAVSCVQVVKSNEV